VEKYLEVEGIKHEFSAPYTPQQSGIVERKNRTLIDTTRMMIGEYKTSNRFLAKAVNTTEKEMCPWAISKYFGD
jgi:transposase InsO family protein